jgi:hypothetical protein
MEAAIEHVCGRGHESTLNHDPRGTETLGPPAGNPRIGVAVGVHHAGNPGFDEAIGTGWGTALVATGFKGHIGRGSARRITCFSQRHPFGMRPTGVMMKTAADDTSILDDDAPDTGIGLGRILPLLREA